MPNLDLVLGGGIRRGAVLTVIGAPGTGKTVLAQQLAFASARRGERVLFLTGYSETHDKLLAYNADMRYFDAELIPDQIEFASLTELLARGIEGTEDAIVTTARREHVRMVVLDGFGSMRRLLPDEGAAARFVYSLGAKMAYLGATTIIVLEGDPDETARFGELTVADAAVTMRRERLGTRHRRVLEVLKTRGAAPLNGLHPFTITGDGVHVHPRLESLPSEAEAVWRTSRAGLGVPGLDALTHGGLTAGTTTLVAGDLGTGKTLLGLHYLIEGVRRGEPGLYLGFLESATQLRQQARVFGLDLDAAEASGLVRLLVLPGHETEPDQVAEQLRADVEARGPRRLVVDSVNELRRALVPHDRQPEFFSALIGYLRARAVTTYLALEVANLGSGDLDLADSTLAVLAENLLILRQTEYVGAMRRFVSVLKMRFSGHDSAIHELTIVPTRGIEVVGSAPEAAGLLSGLARPLDNEPRSTSRRRRAP